MARTWNTKIGNTEVNIKALKKEVEFIVGELRKPGELGKYFKEVTGIVGGEEHTSILYSPFSPAREIEGKSEIQSLYDSLPNLITKENCKPYIIKARELFDKYIPIVDKRQTQEERALREANIAVMTAEREAERNE